MTHRFGRREPTLPDSEFYGHKFLRPVLQGIEGRDSDNHRWGGQLRKCLRPLIVLGRREQKGFSEDAGTK